MVRSYFGLFWALRPWCCKQRMPFYCAQGGPKPMSFCLEGTVALTVELLESEIVFPRISIDFGLILNQLVLTCRAGRSIYMQSYCTWLAPREPFWENLCVALATIIGICTDWKTFEVAFLSDDTYCLGSSIVILTFELCYPLDYCRYHEYCFIEYTTYNTTKKDQKGVHTGIDMYMSRSSHEEQRRNEFRRWRPIGALWTERNRNEFAD